MADTWQKAGVEYVVKDSTRGGVSSVTRSLKRLETASRGVVASVGKIAGGFAALAGVGSLAGITYLVKQQMKAADAIGKMSDELAISTEALSAWGHAAELSGTNIETLHKGLQIFVRRIGEAQMGLGEARHGLEALGMTAEDLAAQGPEQAFVTIAEAVSGIEDASKRSQVAYAFFGRQGMSLMNLLMQGRDGIEAVRREAEKLGITFSRLDAAQIEAANDAITRAKAALGGLARQIAIDVAPYIESFANQFAEAAAQGDSFSETLVVGLEAVATAAAETYDYLKSIADLVGWLPGKIEKIAVGMDTQSRAQAEYRRRTGETNAFGFRTVGFGAVPVGPKNPALYQQILAEQQEIEAVAARSMIESPGGSAGDVASAFDRIRAKVRQRRAAVRNEYMAGRADAWLGGEVDFSGVERGTEAFNQQKQAVEDAADAVEDYRVRVAPLMDVTDVATMALEDMAGTLTDIVFDLKNVGQAAEQVASSLARLAVQELVMRPLVRGVGTAMGLYGSEQHAGGIAGTGPKRRLPAAAWALAPRFHDGGAALGAGEIAAILKRREVVLTERDANRFRALGLLNARGKPTFHDGGVAGGGSVPAAGGSLRPNVTVKIDNQSGTAVAEPDIGVEMDPEGYVLSVVLRSASQGGPIRDLMRRRG